VTPAPTRAAALFVRHHIEVDAKGPRATFTGEIGPKQM